MTFSGDEELRVRAIPSPTETYNEEVFDIRFPAASYRQRIPNSTTITFEPTMPVRSISLQGADRHGNAFTLLADTTALSTQRDIDLSRTPLENATGGLDALADVIEELLQSDPALAGLFERPTVTWQDDGDQTGMLHIAISFASGSGSGQPMVNNFDLDGLLPELGTGSMAANFSIPGDESTFQTYLRRMVTDAHARHADFGPNLDQSYFDLSDNWQPEATVDGNTLSVRISLSTKHGRDPATIELVSQEGLEGIGMDNPTEGIGADTDFSGGGGPTFNDNTLFDDVYTKMIDAVIDNWTGTEEEAIAAINLRFNCVGQEDFPTECAFDLIHNVVVTPVYPTLTNGTHKEPDLVKGERGATKGTSMDDINAEQRARPVLSIGANRRKIIMKLAPNGLSDPNRALSSAATLADELGHGIVGLPDLYSGGKFLGQCTVHWRARHHGRFLFICAFLCIQQAHKRLAGR